jgi:sigma-E factor negative regulatory protein RseB
VIARMPPRWQAAGLAALLGLLGSGVAVLVLTDSPTRPVAVKRASESGRLRRQPPAVDAARARMGLRLLDQAAAACQGVSYQGVQMIATWGSDGTTAEVIDVWHQAGRAAVAKSAGTATAAAVPGTGSAEGQDPDGILGLSTRMLQLIQANYQVVYAGQGSALGRSAQIVEVLRGDGRPAARFWVDSATKLPLRRELFDESSHLVSEDAFIDLQVGGHDLRGMPTAAARTWSGRLGHAQMLALRAKGWPLPGKLPDNLVLFAASEASTKGGEVVDLSYSDGLSVVSLFVQRGVLPRAMPGWREEAVLGHTVYSTDPDGRSLVWSADGFVYTLIADAPTATVDRVVASLPHLGQPGFWGRIGRGLGRLASWADPFR